MEKYYSAVLNTYGNVVSNAIITVYISGTLELATIYSDEGITPKENPFLTDVNGRFEFYAPDGDYDIEISGEGIESYKITDITIVDTKEAVELKHTHENKETLDLTEEAFTEALKISYDDASSKAHSQSHSISSISDHTSTITKNKLLKADDNGLPTDATNTDAEVSDAVNNTHSHSNKDILDQIEEIITPSEVQQMLDSLEFQDSVKSRSLDTPPENPAEGDRYIVAVGGKNSWSGKDNQIAEYRNEIWVFFIPSEGYACWIDDENTLYVYNGSSWVNILANLPTAEEKQALVGEGTPSGSNKYTTKEYVDNLIKGITWEEMVKDMLSTPPDTPSSGDRYIVKPTGTGAWEGHDNEIAEYNGTSWEFEDAVESMAVYVDEENSFYYFNGTDWIKWTMGTGNVIGPNSSTDGNVVIFDGTTGKVIKDSGKSISDLTPKQVLQPLWYLIY